MQMHPSSRMSDRSGLPRSKELRGFVGWGIDSAWSDNGQCAVFASVVSRRSSTAIRLKSASIPDKYHRWSRGPKAQDTLATHSGWGSLHKMSPRDKKYHRKTNTRKNRTTLAWDRPGNGTDHRCYWPLNRLQFRSVQCGHSCCIEWFSPGTRTTERGRGDCVGTMVRQEDMGLILSTAVYKPHMPDDTFGEIQAAHDGASLFRHEPC